jgi:hypothetical protein
MNLSKIFPSYPLQIVSPRKSNIKIASRRIYVDFPFEYYSFIGEVAYKMSKSKDPQKVFQEELESFNSNEEIKKITNFNNIPLGTISLITTPLTTKLLLKLKINWPIFLQYLESKAQELISKIEEDGSYIREVYNEILANYFRVAGNYALKQNIRFISSYQLENFKKLLRILGEIHEIQNILSYLRQTIENIRKIVKLEGIELWMLQLESDFYEIEKCLENIDILSCYFYLRNALENLIKLIVYSDIAKSFNICNEILLLSFFYEKIAKERCYSIKKLKEYYSKKNILKDISEVASEQIYQVMINKQLPKLGINSQALKEFEDGYKIPKIKNYWSACSEIIHNQSPLPIFSLLEIKSFKHFLRQYSEKFISIIKIIFLIFKIHEEDFKFLIKEDFTYKEMLGKLTKRGLSKKAKKIFYQFIFQEEIEIILKSLIEKNILKGNILFDPLTLFSLFYLSSPSLTHIVHGEFNLEDMENLITKIQPLSFTVKESIKYKFYETLQIFEEEMIPILEKLSSEFSKLSEEEKKVIIFYLLAIKLPEVFMNTFSLS